MEDKKPNNQEDDELRPGSSDEGSGESEDFGLPEASSDLDSDYEEDQDKSPSDDSDSDMFSNDIPDDDDLDDPNEYKYHPSHDDEPRRNPVGLIISFVLIGIIVIAIAVYWFFFREPVTKQVVQRPVVEEVREPEIVEDPTVADDNSKAQEQVVEQPKEPVVKEPVAVVEEGSYETINDRTGRYYIVLNSFFDSDLAKDFAQSLAREGVDAKIIAPADSKKGFHRVVLSNDYGTWEAAEASLGEYREVFGESVWVLKY